MMGCTGMIDIHCCWDFISCWWYRNAHLYKSVLLLQTFSPYRWSHHNPRMVKDIFLSLFVSCGAYAAAWWNYDAKFVFQESENVAQWWQANQQGIVLKERKGRVFM